MRQAIQEGQTLRIVETTKRIAIECDVKDDTITPLKDNERFITHNMSYRGGTSFIELERDGVQKPIPVWLRDIVDDVEKTVCMEQYNGINTLKTFGDRKTLLK